MTAGEDSLCITVSRLPASELVSTGVPLPEITGANPPSAPGGVN